MWWQCKRGHEWHTLISTRSYGSKCPYCSGIKLLKGFNDLMTLHPHLAEEWSERNGDLKPDAVNEKSPKNVWWQCCTCGHEYKAVIKARVHGLQCPVCAQRTVLAGYNDLATTDPELTLEWDYEANKKWSPNSISRYSMYPVWWKGSCGHRWKDKVFNRAVEGAGCIYCESAFRQALPLLLVMLYAKQNRLTVSVQDESAIGVQLDAFIPELKLAFVFPYKGTNHEQGVLQVTKHLCSKRGILCEVISEQEPEELCVAIKHGFGKAHLYIESNNEADIAFLRKRFLGQISSQ